MRSSVTGGPGETYKKTQLPLFGSQLQRGWALPYQRLSPAAFSLGAPQCLLFLFNAFLFHCLHCSTGQEESQALKQRSKSGVEKIPARCQAHGKSEEEDEGRKGKLNLLATFLLGFHCCCRCFLRIAQGSRRRHGSGPAQAWEREPAQRRSASRPPTIPARRACRSMPVDSFMPSMTWLALDMTPL